MQTLIAKTTLFTLFRHFITRRQRAAKPWEHDCHAFETKGFDGITLRGWVHRPPSATRGTLFLLHGFTSHSMEISDFGRELSEPLGLALVSHDHRHHGLSDDGIPSFGFAEYQDLLQVVAKAREMHLPEPFLVAGDSLGALVIWQAMAEPCGIRAGLLLNPPGWPWDAVGKTMKQLTIAGSLIDMAYDDNFLHKGAAYARGDRLWPEHRPQLMVVIGSHDHFDWRCAREIYDRWYDADSDAGDAWPSKDSNKLKWFHLVEGAGHPGNSGYTVFHWPPLLDLARSFLETALTRHS